MIPGILKYFQGLLGVVIRTGRVPVLSKLVQAHKAGDMSRREFFRSIVGMGKEAKLQGDYMKSVQKLKNNKLKGLAEKNANQALFDKEAFVNKEIKRRVKISESKKFLNLAKELEKNPSKLKSMKNGIVEMRESEFYSNIGEDVSDLSLTESKSILNNIKKAVEKMTPKEVAGQMQDYSGSYGNSPILNRMKKRVFEQYSFSDSDSKKLWNIKEKIRNGDNFAGKDMSEYFKAREALRKHTNMSHTNLVQYNSPNYMSDKGAQFPGIDVAPKSEDVKKIANPVKEAWDEIVKAFYEGMTD
tara:strand:- start:592 stop:1491 length:900 start_codon:yes stop_codon:yes gene_type:complete